VFPVRYELNLYILFRRNLGFNGFIKHRDNFAFTLYLGVANTVKGIERCRRQWRAHVERMADNGQYYRVTQH
jgi:hypothetical protein